MVETLRYDETVVSTFSSRVDLLSVTSFEGVTRACSCASPGRPGLEEHSWHHTHDAGLPCLMPIPNC